MEVILNLTKEIMIQTCSSVYVPPKFFTIAYEAFITFVKEDFFTGLGLMGHGQGLSEENSDPELFSRILSSLQKCLERSGNDAHVFQHEEMECGVKKVRLKLKCIQFVSNAVLRCQL
jgi:hypothetical protein